MSTDLPRPLVEIRYFRAAQDYLRQLPLEHFMEATAQGRQRAITLASLELVKAERSDFYLFNELLVQYPQGRAQKIHQVVPDNMVVVSDQAIRAEGSYDVPLQPVGPFWVLEYVSKSSERKDYQESFQKYERELKVPYYLVFYPDNQELTLFHLKGRKYVSVKPNAANRFAIPELDLEVALHDGWARFWHKGHLLPLPAEMQRELDDARRQLRQVRKEADEFRDQVEQERHENEQLRAQIEQQQQEKERLLAQLRALGIEPQ
jgi:Uma2 family endonuclease